MLRVGIAGSYGGLNTGDEAILTSLLAELGDRLPTAEFVVFSRNADHTSRHHDLSRAVQTRDVSRDDVIPEIADLDLFVLGGGGLLFDGEARPFLRDVLLAQERDIPTCTFAVGAGPLDDPEDRRIVAQTLNAMRTVTVRDAVSKRVLEDAGVDQPIEVTADPALLLHPRLLDGHPMQEEGVTVDGPLVGMSVREPGNAAPHLDEHSYHQLLAHAADFVVHRFQAEIVFLPMEFDDVRHSHAVIGQMLAADRAHVLKQGHGPLQLLSMMEQLEFVVGMRLHVLMFAALAGVPFLPLPYASKIEDFVTGLGLTVPPAVRLESAGTLLATLDEAWDHRDQQRQLIRQRLPDLQARARRTAGLVAGVVSERHDCEIAS